jgi:CRP/FNR family transcriptional regulator, cyclic AMP receptor protein
MKPLVKTFKAGTALFHENDRSRELYIIQSGNVKIYKMNGNKEIEIVVLGKGAVFGEMALIDGKPRSASAKAVNDCSVVIIDSETFNQKIAGVPSWFMSIIRMASNKIRQANERLKLSHGNYEGPRIVIALLHLFRKYHFNNAVPITSIQNNLIELLGVTYQTTSLVIEFLLKHRFIEIENDHLSIVVFSQYCEYCEFLRMMMRKAFVKMPEIPSAMQKILIDTATANHSILHSSEQATPISGNTFWDVLCKAGLDKEYNNIILFLRDHNLLSAVKSENKNTDKDQNPIASYQFKINNANWKKLCLYVKFKDYMIIA